MAVFKNTSRWMHLIAGVIILFFSGIIIYAWSIWKTPLLLEFQWTNAELGINYTIMMGCFCLGGIISGNIMKKLFPKTVIYIGACLILFGFISASLLAGQIIMLYIAYGMCCGFGIGMIYNAVISTVTSWFPDKRATASGAMMMGFGASSLVLGALVNNVIDTQGWRFCFRMFGIIIFVMLFLATQFIRHNPDSLKVTHSQIDATLNLDSKQMLGHRSFWLFYIFSALISSIGSYVISSAKDIAISVGMMEWLAVMSVGILSLFNGLARIIFGLLYDAIGSKKSILITNSLAIIGVCLLITAEFTSSIPIGLISFAAIGLSYGALPTLSSGYVSSTYGPLHFAMNFSIASTFLFPSSLSASIGSALQSSTGNYTSVFVMLVCFSVLAFILGILMIRTPNNYRKLEAET